MAYSNNTPEWAGSSAVGNQYGWMGHIWTALASGTSEPDAGSTDWQLDTPMQCYGFGIAETPDPKDYLKVIMHGFGIAEEFTNRPPEVKMFGFGMTQYRPDPFIQIYID